MSRKEYPLPDPRYRRHYLHRRRPVLHDEDSAAASVDTRSREVLVLSPHHRPKDSRGSVQGEVLSQQVEELQNSLHETDDVLTETERMLSDYQSANTRQSREMNELQSELHRSREILSSRNNTPRPSHAHACCGHTHSSCSDIEHCRGCGHEQKVLKELEREKEARERAEVQSCQMMSLLDTSIRSQTLSQSEETKAQEGVTDKLRDLTDSHKKLESSNEQRLREIEEKLKEGSLLNKTEGAFEEMSQQVSQLKQDLWQREASEKRRKMLQEIKGLEIDLSAERQQHSTSVRQTRKLYSQVKQLGQELGQVKYEKEQALSCLEATSQHLNKSLNGREDLVQKIEDLQQALVNSETQRIQCVEKCGHLSQECFKQEVCQESLRQRIKEVEAKVLTYKEERMSLEDHQHLLSQELSEKTLSECRLQDQCHLLQQRLLELEAMMEGREEELEGMARKLETAEKAYNKGNVEMVQLRADLKNTQEQKNSLDSKIQVLEDNLYETRTEFEKLRTELKEASEQLTSCAREKTYLEVQIEEGKKTNEQIISRKKTLQSRISKLEHQLEEAEKRQKSSYSQALQAVKKFKTRAQQTAQEKNHIEKERDSILARNDELQKQLVECQSVLKHDQCKLSKMEKEILDLNTKLTGLQNQCDEYKDKNEHLHHQVIDLEATCAEEKGNFEKCQHELVQCRHDNENLKQEITLLQQNLESSLERAQATEKRLHIELTHARELSESQIEQLKNEIEICRTDKSKLTGKYKKLLGVHQSLKSEFEAHRLEYDIVGKEKSKMEKNLEDLQQQITRKEQEFLDRAETWKCVQSQEMKKLKQKHSEVTISLQQSIELLESRLADEQAIVHEVRRQQLQVLDNQQKVYADDLSKSMEDTERVRQKYLKAKRIYEDKAASLENDLSNFCGENESLRQRLTESQASLLQQVEEHESILRAAAKEVDIIVHQMGLRVDIPMFPTIVGDETDIKKWMADMLAKLKWLQKEVTDLLTEENKLRRKVKSEHKNDPDSLDNTFHST